MPEETKSQENRSTNPLELWKQWYQTWTDVLDGDKAVQVDPYGLYQSWLKSVGNAQEQMLAGPFSTTDPKEAWKKWFDATTEGWRKIAQMGGDPLGLTNQWLETMEANRAQILAGGASPTDPFAMFKQWYDATSETWSKLIGDVIGTEQFIQAGSRLLESYLNFARASRQASQQYFSNLQLPTRADIARVAGLVVDLEEKVDRIEDTFGDFEVGYSQVATSESIANVQERLERVESKLDAFPAALQKIEALDSLSKRLNQVESKLDTVLAALEKIAAPQQAGPKKPVTTPRPASRTPRRNASRQAAGDDGKQ